MRPIANKEAWFTASVLVACLLPWLLIQPQIRLPGDAANLTLATLDFLSGQRMTDAYFDNNPPLCFLIFLPAALMTRLGLPMWYAVPAYALGLIGIGAWLMHRLLAGWPGLATGTRRAAFAAYLGAITLPCFLEFGQKDHLIAIMLPPFLLAQWSLTQGHVASRKTCWAAFALGAPFILIKPHYGLLPVALLAQRFMRQKRWSIVLDADFAALAVGTILYAATVQFWFPDYITVVLPLALSLYAGNPVPAIVPAIIGLAMLVGSVAVVAVTLPKNETRTLALVLTSLALLAGIVFALQLKGFYLHALPCLVLLFMTGVVTICASSQHTDRAFTFKGGTLGIIAIFSLLYAVFPPLAAGRTHRDYEIGPLAVYVRTHAAGSSWYLQNINANIIASTSVYTGLPLASRFPVLWFMFNGALSKSPSATQAFFANAMAQDMDRFHPAFIGLLHNPPRNQNLLGFFAGNEFFTREWTQYHFAGEFSLDHGNYPDHPYHSDKSIVMYDIYERLPATR